MKFSSFPFRQTAVLLFLSASTFFSRAQVMPDSHSPHLKVFSFYKGWYDNVIDSAGNVLFREDWNRIWRFGECGKFLGIRMLHDTSGNRKSFYDGIPAEFALLSPDGNRTILPFREIGYVHGRYMAAGTGDGWGVVDCNLDWLQKPVFGEAPILFDRHMLFLDRNAPDTGGTVSYAWGGALGLADYSGNILAPAAYSDIHALDWWEKPHFILMRGNRSCLIDDTGKELIPLGDHTIYPSLSDESVWIISKTDQKVYYPAAGRWITEDLSRLTEGLYGSPAGMKLEVGPEGYRHAQWVSGDGSLRLNATPEEVGTTFDHPYLRIQKDGKYGVVAKSGKTILPCIYDNIYEKYPAYPFEHSLRQCVFEGTVSVELDGSWGLADSSGKYLTHFVYDGLREVSEGIAAADVDGKTGFIDLRGNKVVPFVFDWTDEAWENGIGAAYLGESRLLVNRQGRILASELGEGGPASVDELRDRQTFTSLEKYLQDTQEEFGEEMRGVEWVDLSGRGLTSIPDLIDGFPDMVFLDLAYNHISRLDGELPGFAGLEELNLSNNRFREFPAGISSLLNLSVLNLSDNQLHYLPAGLFNHPGLKELVLTGNSIDSLPELPSPNKTLEILNLSDNQIVTLPSSFSSLRGLKALYLAGNRIANLPSEIGKMKKLEYIDLGGNNLESLPESLLKLKNLARINLRGNPVPPAEIDRIVELRPDIEMDHN